MTCEELAEVYELYALGVLDGPEKDALDDHLNRCCVNCMKEINRAFENNANVFRGVPNVDPPASLRARTLAGFGVETRPFWLRAMPWAVALASVALLLLTVTYPARQNPVVDFLSTPGTRQVSFGKDGPHGSVLMQREKGILLVVVNLPAVPSGKMYETWLVPGSGAPQPVGQLKSTDRGNAVAHIPGPLNMSTIQAVAVSVEPAGSNPASPTKVLFTAPLDGG
jgi:anti-sigma-K factor RskA